MDNSDSTPPTEPVDLRKFSAEDAPTINQLVAYNMTQARRSRGWTQQEVAERLEKYTGRPWSKASISAAERAWQGGRPRKFDANELVALAVIFETPVSYFLLPMEEGNKAVVMAQPEDQKAEGSHWMGVGLLLRRLLMDELQSKGGSEFLLRARSAAFKHLGASWHAPTFVRPSDLLPPSGSAASDQAEGAQFPPMDVIYEGLLGREEKQRNSKLVEEGDAAVVRAFANLLSEKRFPEALRGLADILEPDNPSSSTPDEES